MYQLLSLPGTDLILRTKWYVRIRWLVLTAVAVPGVLTLYLGEGWTDSVRSDALLALVAVASNSIFYFLSRLNKNPRFYRVLAATLLIVDTLLVTALIFTKGGIESRSAILYVLPIMMSATLFGRKAVYLTALVAALAYSSVLVGDYYGVINTSGAYNPELKHNYSYMLNSVFFFGSILLITGALADFIITLLKDKERQASQSAAALSRAQAIAKVGSWEWDAADGKLTVSDELKRTYGLTRLGQQIKLDDFLNKIHPDDRATVKQALERAVKNGRSFHFDHRLARPNGSLKYIHCEGQALHQPSGSKTLVVGTAHDVTDVWVLDKAKNEFVSLASHQLRTPATGIKAYLGLLAEGYAGPLTDLQKQYISKAYGANERQLRIIDDLLNIALIESGKMALNKKLVDLDQLVDVVVDEHSGIVKSRQQQLEVVKPVRPLYVSADSDRLKVVLDNLVSNASKYTPTGGKLTIKLYRRGGMAAISVSDTGIGIAAKDMAELFQKFDRIDSAKHLDAEGNGLGLYLVKRLVELHKGKITVKSKLGRGSNFTIYIGLPSKKALSAGITAEPPTDNKRFHLRPS